jgi:hypothetical protein
VAMSTTSTAVATSAVACPAPPLVAALGGVCHSLCRGLGCLCVKDCLVLLLLNLCSVGLVVLLPNEPVDLGMVAQGAVPTLGGLGDPAHSAVHGILDLVYLH